MERLLQESHGGLQASPHQVEETDVEHRDAETERVVRSPSRLDGFSAPSKRFIEVPGIGEAPHQTCAGQHRGQPRHAEALARQPAVEDLEVAPEEDHGPAVLAEQPVRRGQVQVGGDAHGEVVAGLRDNEGPLARLDGQAVLAHQTVLGGEVREDAAQAGLVGELAR